jgi:hypothetical protein|tara:strand:+ start:8 stop:373 length:366 start_codon:yes stop_codon:yes gene_type:complete
MAKYRDPLANSQIYLARNKEPEQDLWISVLTKAVDDAFQGSDFGEALKAINWIKHDGADFRKVCDMAGRSPQYIRERILQALLEREKRIVENTERIRNYETKKLKSDEQRKTEADDKGRRV